MRAIIGELAKIPEIVLLGINAAIGTFVFLAHGGALLLILSRKIPVPPDYEAMVRTMVPVTLPIASFVVLGSLVGIAWPKARLWVLSLQGIVLFVAGAALLGWAVTLVIHGIPVGNFAWTPGLLTGWIAYSSFLLARFSLRGWREDKVRYMPLIAAAIALPVDAAVFLRLLGKMSRIS
jgi:hypothetical protein